MLWLCLFLPIIAFTQIDLSAIQELNEELPDYTRFRNSREDVKFQRSAQKYRSPMRKIRLEEIRSSGTSPGSIKQGAWLRNIESNISYKTHKMMYVNYFNVEDEFGFKYLASPEGKTVWKTPSENVNPIREDLVLYEAPLKYTPAPTNVVRREYDSKLAILPEISYYAGQVRGDYIADLFENKRARQGFTNQYGIHFFTQWKLPVKTGAVLHFERSSYRLGGGGNVVYNSFSIGPQLKTSDFELLGQPVRLQLMLRLGPQARMESQTTYGDRIFKFNSTDLLASLERPIRNVFGEFVFGVFYQTQWLNLRDQNVPVQLRATNKTNTALGISLAQVF
jgi:hypothetical protein